MAIPAYEVKFRRLETVLRGEKMKLQHTRYFCLMLLLGSTLLGVLNAQSYTTFVVPEAAGATANSLGVQSINKSGVIAGFLTDASGNLKTWQRAAKGNITVLVDPLDTSTPTVTSAYGIARNGTMTGYFFDTETGFYSGFFYSGGGAFRTYNVPGQPAGTDTVVSGINDQANQFCGFVLAPPYTTYQAFVSINGAVSVFSVDGSNDTQCLALNNLGQAAGSYIDGAGVTHGWVRDSNGTITIIDVPGAVTAPGAAPCYPGTVAGTTVNGINDKGFISGHYWDRSYKSHGYVLTPGGTFIKFNVPGAFQTGGGGLNAAGVMVGHWSDSSCNNAGFIFTPPTPDSE